MNRELIGFEICCSGDMAQITKDMKWSAALSVLKTNMVIAWGKEF